MYNCEHRVRVLSIFPRVSYFISAIFDVFTYNWNLSSRTAEHKEYIQCYFCVRARERESESVCVRVCVCVCVCVLVEHRHQAVFLNLHDEKEKRMRLLTIIYNFQQIQHTHTIHSIFWDSKTYAAPSLCLQ